MKYVKIKSENSLTNLLVFAGLERLDQAEQYLSQAEWTVLKTENVGNDYKAKLYKNMGLLYDAKKNYQEALRNFANGVSFL